MWITPILFGLFIVSSGCEGRAVNISNTWTVAAEGLNVFYRFFRDKISWFEADAVCQFHHANLVTVDNSFQFDASRELLKELDINDIVWIGLMRPQSSERFMWSTSHSLAPDTGYWAEALPVLDTPLCAVIDPIRDYRWHALRCGGPETASFLCEMNVPSWAESCILKDIPNLTTQYMADTANIELIRDCKDEGILKEECHGKQDLERILKNLQCKSEKKQSASSVNPLKTTHFKSLEIIKSIKSDNKEDNSLSTNILKPLEEKDTVEKLIETFNVGEIMQSDKSNQHFRTRFNIPGEIPKPVKKVGKKTINEKKYDINKKKVKGDKDIKLDDVMMGDQPIEDVANEIDEPLPHIKKSLPQDLKPNPNATVISDTTTSTTTPAITTVMTTQRGTTMKEETMTTVAGLTASVSEPVSPLINAANPATIGHPMYPQQPRGNTITTDETVIQHIKETNESHFIPPMLMVKSHYQSPKSHEQVKQPVGLTTTTIRVPVEVTNSTADELTTDVTTTIIASSPVTSTTTVSTVAKTTTDKKSLGQSSTSTAEELTTISPVEITTTENGVLTTKHNIFASNIDEDAEAYKPNRHRSLTKPENTSYIKKILG